MSSATSIPSTTASLATSTMVLTTTPTGLSATSFNPSSIDNRFTGVSTSTLLSTQSAIPTIRRPLGCGGGFETIDTVNPACAMQATDSNALLMQQCCNGAPRIIYASNCNIYCNAQGQTLQQLSNCLGRGVNGTGYQGGVLCNRAAASFTSLLPEETDSRSFTVMATRAAATTMTSAAAAPGGPSTGVRDKVGGVSVAAWGMVVMLAVSGFAGMLL